MGGVLFILVHSVQDTGIQEIGPTDNQVVSQNFDHSFVLLVSHNTRKEQWRPAASKSCLTVV